MTQTKRIFRGADRLDVAVFVGGIVVAIALTIGMIVDLVT